MAWRIVQSLKAPWKKIKFGEEAGGDLLYASVEQVLFFSFSKNKIFILFFLIFKFFPTKLTFKKPLLNVAFSNPRKGIRKRVTV